MVVAGSDNTILSEDKHGTRAFHLIIYVAYAVHEIFALGDKERHQLCGVRSALTQFSEMLALVETVVDKLVQIIDLGHRADGKLAQVGVDDNGLSIGVADDANAFVASKLVYGHLIAELSAEISVLDVVDGTVEHVAIMGHHTSSFSAEM